MKKDDTEKEFMLTDGCLWEMQRQNATFHPHAIEVVDLVTGQMRYIKSGAVIRFVRGEITEGRSQENYNKQSSGTKTL